LSRRGRLLPAALLALLLGAGPAAEPSAPDADRLVARALAAGLDRDPGWQALLHRAPGLFAARGRIDTPAFYLAPDGRSDAAAELAATLRGLCDSAGTVAERFPARSAFLGRRLGLPQRGSAGLARMLAGFQPRRAVLVFACGHPAAPPSMFGHTLLLVRGAEQSPLLAQAVNFAADTPGAIGPWEALRGLSGQLPGRFSMLPYHRKVQEYTDLDQRDLWEYELDLDAGECAQLLAHLWELRETGSGYWFLDENCSFNLLFLLEVARPGLRLTARAGPWVPPLETVRWVREAGLVTAVRWRPSRATVVQHGGQAVGGAGARLAVGLARGALAPAELAESEPDPARRAQVLDLAGEDLHALAGRQAIAAGDYRTRLHAVLAARAALGGQPGLPPPLEPPAPDRGHGGMRAGAAAGCDDGEGFLQLGFRPAQHDLLDRADGYVAGSEVRFAEVVLRGSRSRHLRLHRLDLLSAASIQGWEPVFRRLSWRAGVGAGSERMGPDGDWRLQATAEGGAGLGLRPLPALLAWGLATAEVRAFHAGPGYALGPGAETGAVLDLGRCRLAPRAALTWRALGWQELAWVAGGRLRADLTRWLAFDAGIERGRSWDLIATRADVGFLAYF
jgi:hypothetical protein